MEMENSKSSSEETDRSDQDDDDVRGAGAGRSYDCVFCKRGFTTAQALGGHMNVHRKDRDKANPNSVPSVSSKAYNEDYATFRAFPPIQIFPHHYGPMPHEVHLNYNQTYFPAPTCEFRSQHGSHIDNSYLQSSHDFNPFGEAWPRSLSLQIAPSHPQVIENREDGRKDELDLELRLGCPH